MIAPGKKRGPKGPRKRLTAKTLHNKLQLDLFADDADDESEIPRIGVVDANAASRKPRSPAESARGSGIAALLGDKHEYRRIRENSERFYDRLLGHNSGADFSQVVVFDGQALDALARGGAGDPDALAPVLSHPKAASYGFIVLPPGAKCGPVINTRNILVLVFIEAEDGRVFFENFNAVGRSRVACKSHFHAVVIPNDVFALRNESAAVTARILAISCRKKWKGFSELKGKRAVPLDAL